MVFVSKMDLENADYFKILEQLKIDFGPTICPCVVPARLDDGTVAYINLFSQKAFKYESGKQIQIDLPDIGHRFAGLIEAMNEAIAETDEALMEKFFEGEPFTTEEIVSGMAAGVRAGQIIITPVFCGSAVNQQALDMLLYNMKELLPAADAAAMMGEDAAGEPVEVACDASAPTCAYVFKTVADPFVGKLSFVKVLGGKLTSTSNVVNSRTGQAERLGKMLTICGKKQTDAAAIPAGDIGAVAKLTTAKTGDTLCDPARVVKLPAPTYPIASYQMAVRVAKKGDEGKVSGALARLIEEDPAITFAVNPETKQQVIGGLGTQHLEVAVAKLKNKFGVEVTLETPRIPYRESIRKKCKAQGRHKKQTGGHGQFGDVWVEFEPWDCEELVFEEKVFGGSVPKNFFPRGGEGPAPGGRARRAGRLPGGGHESHAAGRQLPPGGLQRDGVHHGSQAGLQGGRARSRPRAAGACGRAESPCAQREHRRHHGRDHQAPRPRAGHDPRRGRHAGGGGRGPHGRDAGLYHLPAAADPGPRLVHLRLCPLRAAAPDAGIQGH